MTIKSLTGRLERLERRARPGFDAAKECALYGEPAYPGAGDGPVRTYSRQDGEDYRLTVVSPAGTLTYVVPGIDGRELT